MLTAVALSLLCGQALPVPPKPFTAGPSVEGFTEYRLPNGLKVVLVPDPSTPKVTVNLTVFVGSRHEGYGEKGMAHLLEHLLFKGTPSHADPKSELTNHGADFNGTTAEDRTNYFEILPATDANLDFAIRFEADRLVNSFVAKKDLDTEMTVVRNEFEGTENNGMYALRSRVRAAALPWHNYGRAVIGTRADIERVPTENLQAFYRRYYQPDNALLIVTGKFDVNRTLGLIAASFGKIPAPKRQLPNTVTEEPVQDGERSVTVRRVGGNPAVLCAWRVPAASDPDYPALMVLQGVMGDVPQGREHQALVDGKKASFASCDLDQLKEPGLSSCMAVLRAGDDLDKVKATLLTVAEQFAQTPPTPAEVDRARTGWLSQMENSLNSTDDVGVGLSNWASIGDWRMLFVLRDRLKQVTPQDVTAVAQKYFKPQNRTCGDYVPTEKPDRAEIPLASDVGPLVNALKQGPGMSQGEAFDPSPANIDSRTARAKLSNGAKLVFLPKKTRGGTVQLAMQLHFGSPEQLKGQREVAALAIDLLERGTKKLPYKDFRNRLEALKAQVGLSAGVQEVVVSAELTRPELRDVLDLIADALTEPAFDPSEFEALKKERLTGLERQKTEPSALGAIALSRALSPRPKDSLLYQPTTEEQVAAISAVTLDQVRAFHAKFLGAQNAEIAVLGDFDPAEVQAKLEARLGHWSSKEKYVRVTSTYVEAPAVVQEIAVPDKAQAWVGAGFPMKATHDGADGPALVLMNAVVGASPAARLFVQLREKQGLSYGAYSRLRAPESAFGDQGAFWGLAIYAPQNLDKIERALKNEFDALMNTGVKPAELDAQRKVVLDERAQAWATDRSLVFQLAANEELARTMAWEAQYDERLRAVTADQLNAVIKRSLDPSKMSLVKAGSFKTVAAPK